MADSPAFNPPQGTVKDTDPMVQKVKMSATEWGFRESQARMVPTDSPATGPISHIPNRG